MSANTDAASVIAHYKCKSYPKALIEKVKMHISNNIPLSEIPAEMFQIPSKQKIQDAVNHNIPENICFADF